MKALNKILKDKKTLLFVDFEGTQFTHEIIATGIYKCYIDETGNIIDEPNDGLLIYSKPRSQIGKIVTRMTSLTEEFIAEHGISFKDTITKIEDYIGEDLENALFVCFGSSDPKMVLESCRISHPENSINAKKWLNQFFDLMQFISQYIRDDHNNTYSLVNFLKLYNVEPVGISHNPLNDAKDLKNLYKAFISNPDILFNEYNKVLQKMKIYPAPVAEVIRKLSSGEDVTSEEFSTLIRNYLE